LGTIASNGRLMMPYVNKDRFYDHDNTSKQKNKHNAYGQETCAMRHIDDAASPELKRKILKAETGEIS
jgi:hypothetical protein